MILVTGAAGFIGSTMCHYLVKKGDWEIVGVDKLSAQSNREWITPLESGPGRMIFVQMDLTKKDQVKNLFKRYPISRVIHLAAETHVDRSIDTPGAFWLSNVMGTHNLMYQCYRWEVDVIINQITDEVYGPIANGESFEGDMLLPTSPYAASKASQYMVGKSYLNTYNLPIISTFPTNTFGPRQNPEKLIPKFACNLLEGKKVPLMKSSHFSRDWLAVDDHVAALDHLLDHGIIGEDYNIPGQQMLTNLQVTNNLLRITGRDSSYIEEVPDRLAHDCRYCVNGDRIAKLGWAPEHRFEPYLETTVQWYKDYYGLQQDSSCQQD